MAGRWHRLLLMGLLALLFHLAKPIQGVKQSHYTILGIDKTANEGEIKRAYRRLALTTHPDKGGDVEKFKKINEAYQTLSDAKKRESYDLYGEEAINQGNPFRQGYSQQRQQQGTSSPFAGDPMSDLNELLESLFGKGTPPRTDESPITKTIQCSLEELVFGARKKYRVRSRTREHTFSVVIKKGYRKGTKITYPPSRSFPIGVVFTLGEPKPHELFTQKADDLVLKKPVKISREQKQSGDEISVPTIDGTRVTLKVDVGVRNFVRRLEGRGMPKSKSRGGGRGDLIVKVEVAG